MTAIHDFDDEMPWEEQVRRAYREVVDEAGSEGITRKEAVDLVLKKLRADIDSGALNIPVDGTIRRAIESGESYDQARVEDVLGAAAAGQDALDLEGDPILEFVVKLGQGQRKTWRWVTRADFMELDRLRWDNTRRALDAYDRWRVHYDAWLPILDRHQYFGEAYEAADRPDYD